MSTIELNYKIEAFDILLNEDCILSRYYPLIPYKSIIIGKLKEMGCRTKKDCSYLTDDELIQAGLPGITEVLLFRAFLNLYDISKQKTREIEKATATDEEKTAYYELFKLPGVSLTRAALYYMAGYVSLQSIADALPEDIITSTTNVITVNQLNCKPPFIKEAKTHIAVAKALTEYAV